MTSTAQNQEFEQREISATLQRFYSDYRIAALLRACRGEKRKGISAFRIFQYLLFLVFSDRSMYMQYVTGRFAEMFSKNTMYRFLSAAKTKACPPATAISSKLRQLLDAFLALRVAGV